MGQMDWSQLLVKKRFHSSSQFDQENRTGFQRDMDRLLFCGAFRRLQGKTQVHPLPKNDHVHNRLTHSLEVCSVARTLGTSVGNQLSSRKLLPDGLTPNDVGTIVQSAALAHDIGNPPFGHACEDAIGSWMAEWLGINRGKVGDLLSDAEKADLVFFDGNAQGFRILTRLEQHFDDGGLRLSYPTLGAFLKYPWILGASIEGRESKASAFFSEKDNLTDVAMTIGLIDNGKGGRGCRAAGTRAERRRL